MTNIGRPHAHAVQQLCGVFDERVLILHLNFLYSIVSPKDEQRLARARRAHPKGRPLFDDEINFRC